MPYEVISKGAPPPPPAYHGYLASLTRSGPHACGVRRLMEGYQATDILIGTATDKVTEVFVKELMKAGRFPF